MLANRAIDAYLGCDRWRAPGAVEKFAQRTVRKASCRRDILSVVGGVDHRKLTANATLRQGKDPAAVALGKRVGWARADTA
jgi:hypothetical protein